MKLIIRSICMILFCVLWLCLGACDSQEKESSVPDTTSAAASTPQPATTPSPSPIPTLKPTPTPAPTPTAAPTATPTPEYRDITDAEYKTLFNEEITEERLAYILQYLPVGSCENGLSAIAAKNVWENFNMTDNMAISEVYDLRFEDNAQTVTGDASKMFAWFGIVNNKGIHNDPSDDSVVIDGDTLTIDNSKATHANRLDPKIVLGKVSENDMYIYYSYSTEFDNRSPDMHRTAVFKKDKTGKYQVSEIVERELWSVAPAPEEYGFSIINIPSEDMTKEYLAMFAAVLQDKCANPQEYYNGSFALAYVDSDDTPELIWMDSMAHFGMVEVYYYSDHNLDMHTYRINYGAFAFLEKENTIWGASPQVDYDAYEWTNFIYNDEDEPTDGLGNGFRVCPENIIKMAKNPELFIISNN
jgi:hypothetical protein